MLVPNRNLSSPEYRYGFQGQEKDDEIKGNGNSVNYKFRMHDPRVGRFFAVDPLSVAYPENSPYSFSENDVLRAVELEGGEKKIVIHLVEKVNDEYIIIETNVHIENDFKKKTLLGNLVKTEVFYAYKNGEVYKGEVLWEFVEEGLTPSSGIDYTNLELGSEAQKAKEKADKIFAGYNPLKWLKITKRDFNALENQDAKDLKELSPLLAVVGLRGLNLYSRIAKNSKNQAIRTKAVELHALRGSVRVPFKVTKSEAMSIGKSFVGKGYTKIYRKGKLHALQSKDGTKLFRLPVKKLKNGVPTGKYDANLQTRKDINVSWKNGQAVKRGDITNTHLGIKSK